MTKIVCTSDWHGELPTNLPTGDILVVAGDLLPVWDHDRKFQANWLKGHLRDFLAELAYEEILVIAGNHDFVMQDSPKTKAWFTSSGVGYLQDESIVIAGIKFYGTPWSGRFGNWAFMDEEINLQYKWSLIPDDTDVLIVHGPPFGVCDEVRWPKGNRVGSRSLRERIVSIKPALVVTGHIHEGYGKDMIGRTTVANVSLMSENYDPVNEAMVFDINPRK